MYNLITKSATVVSKQKNTHTLLVVTVYKSLCKSLCTRFALYTLFFRLEKIRKNWGGEWKSLFLKKGDPPQKKTGK